MQLSAGFSLQNVFSICFLSLENITEKCLYAKQTASSGETTWFQERKKSWLFPGDSTVEMSIMGTGVWTNTSSPTSCSTRLNPAALGSQILWGLCLTGIPIDVKDNSPGSTHKSYLIKSKSKGKGEQKVELVNLERMRSRVNLIFSGEWNVSNSLKLNWFSCVVYGHY